VGSVTYRNPNDQPFPINQIVITGRPPGGTNADGPYLDLTPTLGPITIPPKEQLTYVARRTMLDTDPLGIWNFYPTYQDRDDVWHDGASKTMEVVLGEGTSCLVSCGTGETCCEGECVNLMTDVNNCGACGNACPFENSLCCNGTCANALDGKTCGACDVDCSLILNDDGLTCMCLEDGSGDIACRGSILNLELCLL
jgi:hypothetical protein